MKFWMGTQWPPPQAPSEVHTVCESLSQTLLGLPVRSAKIVGSWKVTKPPRVRPDMQAGGENCCALRRSESMLALFAVEPLTTPVSVPAGIPPHTRPMTG